MRNLPLRYRLPNPPPVYEGRADEERWLARQLERAQVAVVEGPGGIGKTALVLHVMSRRVREEAVLYVDIRPAEPPEDLRLEVARALVAGHAVEGLDWAGLTADPEALGAVIVDLAETGHWHVVLDDIQNADEESVRDLIRQVERYARGSRWVLMTRSLPAGLRLEDRVLALGGMEGEDLARLARTCAPDRDEPAVEAAVRAASGSPWRLLQVLAAPPAELASSAAGLLEDLDQATRDVLRRLSVLRVPVREEVLLRYLDGLTVEALASLEQRGLLDRAGDAFRLHDVVRDAIEPVDPSSARDLAAELAPLLESEDPASALEALRLHLASGHVDRARALLARRGEELLGAGYAHRLWRLVAHADDPHLLHWRLRCAVELGDPQILQSLQEPEEAATADRILWARALFALGKLDEAARAAEQATQAAAGEGDHDAEFEAGFLHARSLANLSRWAESIAAFDALDPRSVDDRVRRDVVVARCMVLGGAGEPALRRMREVRPLIADLSPQVRIEMCYAMADLLHELGRTDEAMELLERVDRDERGVSPLLYSQWGRRALYQRATLALSRGALDESREVLSSLWPFMGPASLMRPHLMLADAIVRFGAGELEGVEESFGEVREEGRRRASEGLYCLASVYLRRLAVLRNAPVEEREDPALLLAPETLFGGMLALYAMQGRLRAGEPVSPSVLSSYLDRSDLPELRVAAHVVACEATLVRGDAAEGLRYAEVALEEAARGRLGVALAEASVARCVALLVLDRRGELGEAADELARWAEQMPSSRFAAEARFFAVVAEDGPDPVPMLVEVATRARTSPAAARRAAAVLGHTSALDALDALAVEAVTRRDPWSRISRVDAPAAEDGGAAVDWRRAWGMDAGRQEVWFPGGQRVELASKPLLWRLLVVLSERGAATKEELVLGAWDVREYHPLRHDNRLQVAMRKLRRAIEIDPSRPERVVTTERGYALAGPVLHERPPARLSELPPRMP